VNISNRNMEETSTFSIVQPFVLLYDGLTYQHDSVKGRWLFDNAWFIHLLMPLYIAFALKLGPEFMKKRKAFNVKPLARFCNLLQVVANTYGFIQLAAMVVKSPGILKCLPRMERSLELENTAVWLTWTRILDLLDTVFFILSKKERNVSFLHVYHHWIVVNNTYFISRTGHGYSLFVIGLLNCFVHMIMYSYYFLATFPSLKSYLWWKRHLTKLQLLQFLLVIPHTLYQYSTDCPLPLNIVYNYVANCIIFIYLFGKFYLENYAVKKVK